MNSSQVHHKLIIHEDPYVVISREGKNLGSPVSKSSMKLKAEGVIVTTCIVSESLVINWKEESIVIAVDVGITVSPGCTYSVVESDVDIDWDVPTRSIIPPVWPRSTIVNYCRVFRRTVIYWLSISSQGIHDDPSFMGTGFVLEINHALFWITSNSSDSILSTTISF